MEKEKVKHGKKRTVNEVFMDKTEAKPENIEGEMRLISDLAGPEVPPFLSGLVKVQLTSSTPPVV